MSLDAHLHPWMLDDFTPRQLVELAKEAQKRQRELADGLT